MPELFHCDMDEFYETCEIFSDSADLNGILVVSDEAEPYNIFQFYFAEARATLQTDTYLIKEDHTLKTFHNFLKGVDYLNSSWTDQLHQNQRLHIIYLAVDPNMQHHGIAARLMQEAIDYADTHRMMISLETHNEKKCGIFIKISVLKFMASCISRYFPAQAVLYDPGNPVKEGQSISSDCPFLLLAIFSRKPLTALP